MNIEYTKRKVLYLNWFHYSSFEKIAALRFGREHLFLKEKHELQLYNYS